MNLSDIIVLLSGVALFLFGMSLMGDGLKSVAGSKLELVLYRLSNTPIKGLLLGTGVTAVIQSSCATSVMVVGFVNSGMMHLQQAIGVILGSILGTSITGWIISLSYLGAGSGILSLFSTSTLTGAIAVAGIILRMFCKGQSKKHLGDIFLGFAVLMTGMATMSGAVAPLKESETFIRILTAFESPILGILVGAAFTAVLQSASAAVGILQALSVTGAMSVSAAIPLLLGIGIGASVPVLLSALGANLEGRRTAYVYPVAEIGTVILFSALFYLLIPLFPQAFLAGKTNPFSLAFLNSVVRFIKVLFAFPFFRGIEKLVIRLVPAKEGEESSPAILHPEERFLNHPTIAVEQTGTFMREMAATVAENLLTALNLISDYSDEKYQYAVNLESKVDRYEDSLSNYLIKLTAKELSPKQNGSVSVFLHAVSDLERISDHALNIADNAKELHEKSIEFTDSAKNEIAVMISAIEEILDRTVLCFVRRDAEYAGTVEPLEETIDYLCDRMKFNHISRISKGECTLAHGFVFNDLLTNFERISDHCSNIAVAVISEKSGNYDTHEYLDEIKERKSKDFEAMYQEYRDRFSIS